MPKCIKKCKNCGEMALMHDSEHSLSAPCEAMCSQPGACCDHHVCRLPEGHKDMHECACGFCWETEPES